MTNARRLALPVIALVLGLLSTLAAALLTAQAEEGRRNARFEGLADGVAAAIESRMLSQLTLLRGAAGLFNASDKVTQEEFGAYIARLHLDRNYPGVLGIGYAAYAPDRPALDSMLAEMAANGPSGLHFAPPGIRPDYSVVVYLEPLNRLNRAALGFDMLSEQTRRAAMNASRLSASTRMSGRVQLVQEIESVKQPGFLIYTPLYRQQRDGSRGSIYGWVYSPLRAYDLFGAIFARAKLSGIVVEVFDGAVSNGQLLYRSASLPRSPDHVLLQPMTIAGRRWMVRVTSMPVFDRDTTLPAPLGVGAAGGLISFLIAAMLYLQIRSRERTEEEVALGTAELRTANAQLVAEADARKQAEAKVAQMQKMEAIGQLTGGIAHDFNNMLTVVIGNLDIAQLRIGDPERAARAITHASEGAQRAAELTQRLLAFGRKQALRPRVIDLNALIENMAEMLRRTIGETVQLETRLDPAIWPVCADSAQLESAILNLAINARDAIQSDGLLRIDTGNAVLQDGDLHGAEVPAQGEHVRITVSDTGHGMAPDVLERAVDPFFTTKEVGRGTGLGLSQVYGFVRQSGGHLVMESEPGCGTIIRIYLPRHAETAIPSSAPATRADIEAPRARGGETLLVVEDEDQVRLISVETLQELGYQVLSAGNGREALDVLDRHPEVRLIFTDVVMPGMNGHQLAHAALERRPDLKLLFTTGHTRDAIVPDGRIDGGVPLLSKPFTAAELAAMVRALLDADCVVQG